MRGTIRDLVGPLYRRRLNGLAYERFGHQLERLSGLRVKMVTRLGRHVIPHRMFGFLESVKLEGGRYTISISVELAEIARNGASFALVESATYVDLLRRNELAAALWRYLVGHEWTTRSERRIPGDMLITLFGLSGERPWRTSAIVDRARVDLTDIDARFTAAIVGERDGWALVVRHEAATPRGADLRPHMALVATPRGADLRPHMALAQHGFDTRGKEADRARGSHRAQSRGGSPSSSIKSLSPRQLEMLEDFEAEHAEDGDHGCGDHSIDAAIARGEPDPIGAWISGHDRYRKARRNRQAAGRPTLSEPRATVHDGRHQNARTCIACAPLFTSTRGGE